MPVNLEHSTADLHLLRPLIVPASYFASGTFPAPHRRLRRADLALTWVILNTADAMVYLPPHVATAWDRQGIDWQAQALDNLRLADNGRVWTHEKVDATGSLLWVAMMHRDGLGSSRLLCAAELGRLFPEGYLLALPERSCGLAISARLGSTDLAEVRAVVEQCYSAGTTPMIRDVFEPAALADGGEGAA